MAVHINLGKILILSITQHAFFILWYKIKYIVREVHKLTSKERKDIVLRNLLKLSYRECSRYNAIFLSFTLEGYRFRG